jgi:adenylate kinase
MEVSMLRAEDGTRTRSADCSFLRVLMVGPPGAGKGTQCRILSERYGMHHISTGDLLRRAVTAQTPLGLAVGRYVDAGLLVPDRLVLRLVNDTIAELSAGLDRPPGFLLDGVPRTIHQAEALDALMSSWPIDAVVHVEVPDRVALTRLAARGRDDDHRAALRRRFESYRRFTLPMVAWIAGRRAVLEVEGTGAIERVTADIVRGLRALDPVGSGYP